MKDRMQAGFINRGGKGSHRNFIHPKGVVLTISGKPGDDAKHYQEKEIVDEWIEIYSQDDRPLPPPTAGKKYSGKFQLRLGTELHQALAIRAMQSGDSLNNFCIKSLKKSLQ